MKVPKLLSQIQSILNTAAFHLEYYGKADLSNDCYEAARCITDAIKEIEAQSAPAKPVSRVPIQIAQVVLNDAARNYQLNGPESRARECLEASNNLAAVDVALEQFVTICRALTHYVEHYHEGGQASQNIDDRSRRENLLSQARLLAGRPSRFTNRSPLAIH